MWIPILDTLVFFCHVQMEITFLLQLATVSAFQVNKHYSPQGERRSKSIPTAVLASPHALLDGQPLPFGFIKAQICQQQESHHHSHLCETLFS